MGGGGGGGRGLSPDELRSLEQRAKKSLKGGDGGFPRRDGFFGFLFTLCRIGFKPTLLHLGRRGHPC